MTLHNVLSQLYPNKAGGKKKAKKSVGDQVPFLLHFSVPLSV